jgi:transcriptional regulator with XRE-family HTH domain
MGIESKIGGRIRAIRVIKELSKENMAKDLNISENSYSKIERNEVKHTVERLQQIATIFGMDLLKLLDFEDNNSYNYNTVTSENGNNILGNHTVVKSLDSDNSKKMKKLEEEAQKDKQRITKLEKRFSELEKRFIDFMTQFSRNSNNS